MIYPNNNPDDSKLLLKVNEVAMLLNISERSVWRLVSTEEIPRPIKLGRSRRWSREAIEQFVAKQLNNSPDTEEDC